MQELEQNEHHQTDHSKVVLMRLNVLKRWRMNGAGHIYNELPFLSLIVFSIYKLFCTIFICDYPSTLSSLEVMTMISLKTLACHCNLYNSSQKLPYFTVYFEIFNAVKN